MGRVSGMENGSGIRMDEREQSRFIAEQSVDRNRLLVEEMSEEGERLRQGRPMTIDSVCGAPAAPDGPFAAVAGLGA
jgi:hypothetical protein